MSEWWLLIAVFWFWYLADCLKAGRKARFVLSRAFGRGWAATSHAPISLISASPLAWYLRTEDPPVSFSPEGISNVPVGSAGRPAPRPERALVWRWEEIRQLGEKNGRIFINGQLFCPVSPFTTLAGMRELIDGCKKRAPQERSRWLAGRVAGWFGPAHLRRQRTVLLARTGNLVMLAGFGVVFALLASAYVLFGGNLPLSAGRSALLGRLLLLVGWYLLGLHLLLVGTGWWVHRRLMPKRGEARFSLIFGALLLPPQAYRLRSRIGAEYFQHAHPLAWLAAAAKTADFAGHARQAVADLRWPLRPLQLPDGAEKLYQAISCWMSAQVGSEIERLLRARGVGEEELLKAPKPDDAGSCAYCPRCGSQFTTKAERCPQGVELVRF